MTRKMFVDQDVDDWITALQDQWSAAIQPQIIQARPSIQLMLRKQLADQRAAAATFVGLEIRAAADHFTWKACILGDSCLFHVRGAEVTSYPIQSSAAFGYYPEAFFSTGSLYTKQPAVQVGRAGANDVLMLATDALAEWILTWLERSRGQGLVLLEKLQQFQNQSDFEEFIAKARAHPEYPLKNDDVTLMVLALTPPPLPKLALPRPRPNPTAAIPPRPAPAQIAVPAITIHSGAPFPARGEQQATPADRRRILPLMLGGAGLLLVLMTALFLLRPPSPPATPSLPATAQVRQGEKLFTWFNLPAGYFRADQTMNLRKLSSNPHYEEFELNGILVVSDSQGLLSYGTGQVVLTNGVSIYSDKGTFTYSGEDKLIPYQARFLDFHQVRLKVYMLKAGAK